MELGSQIKQNRARLGFSQDALAERIYVSRQTISSWENDKTYPDVQSLLLLSSAFGVTVDALIKGDVETMEKKVDEGSKRMFGLSLAMAAGFGLFVFAGLWASLQYLWDWGWKMAPTIVLGLVGIAAAIAAAVAAEKTRKDNDLLTYEEVLAYARGKEVDRSTPKSLRIRSGWRGRASNVLPKVIAGAIALLILVYTSGFFAGRLAAMLQDLFF